jgi:hypothetical protein
VTRIKQKIFGRVLFDRLEVARLGCLLRVSNEPVEEEVQEEAIWNNK